MIEYADYLKALDVVRKYREQQASGQLNKNSCFYEWKQDYSAQNTALLEKMFFDGFFNVRSGFLRDLSVKHLSDIKKSVYLKYEGMTASLIGDIDNLCKRAGFVLQD